MDGKEQTTQDPAPKETAEDRLRAAFEASAKGEAVPKPAPEPEPKDEPEPEAKAEKAPEKAPKPAAEKKAPEPEPEDGFKDDERNWKAARQRMKEQAKRIKELEDSAKAKPQEPPPKAPETPAKPAPTPQVPDLELPKPEPVIKSTEPKEQPKPQDSDALPYQPETYFKALVKIDAGDLPELHRADILRTIKERMTPQQVLEVQWKALNGGFGEDSAEIRQYTEAVYPQVDYAVRARGEVTLARQQSWQNAEQVLPGCTTPGSAENAEFKAGYAELLKAVPTLWELPDAPATVAQYVMLKRTEARSQSVMLENQQLKERVAALEQQLGVKTAPQQGGKPPPQPEGKKQSPEEALRSAFRTAGLNA
jgi:hypothetical protein